MIRAGEICHVYQIRGEPGAEARRAAIHAAEALREEWEVELERRKVDDGRAVRGAGPVECEAAWPDWLVRTIQRLHDLGQASKLPAPLRARAISLMIGAEVDDIHAPDITVLRAGTIRFTWQRHKKCASIEVRDPMTIEVVNWTDEQLLLRETYTSKFLEHVRTSIAWIFPEANATDPHQFG